MVRVLVVTPEPVAARLAGPAIRAAGIARALGVEHDVTLVSLAGESVSPMDGRRVAGPAEIVADDFDAAVVQGRVLLAHPELAESDLPLAVDWFDPFHLEALHRGGADRIRNHDLVEGARRTLLQQAHRGDFFICSNHVQRAHWLGWLASAGRVNEVNHRSDPTFAELIDVAPFGIDAIVDRSDVHPIRDEFPVIGPDDPVIVWGGGLHDWLDPVGVVRSMPVVLEENPDARLVFLAGPHPNTSIETMGVRGEAIEAARSLRLFGHHVLFVNRWVPYRERGAWFADASIGVIAHHHHLETANSHRTRLVDHLAAGLPTVSTSGDPGSDLLHASGAAELVPPGEPELMGEALAALIRDSARRNAMGRAAVALARTMLWEDTLAPLTRWMQSPSMAADRRAGRAHAGDHQPGGKVASVDRLVGRARLHWADGGARQVVDRSVRAARRRLSR